MPQYGEVRVDFITYTTGVGAGEANVTVPVSGLVNNPTFSGNIVIKGDATIEGDAFISGDLTVTGDASFEEDVFISGGLTVSGGSNFENIWVSGTVTATGNISGEANGGVYGTNYWKIPAGTVAERPGEAGQPAAVTGMIRYNTTNAEFEGWDGQWGQLGGGATGASGDKVFILNETGVNHNYTLTGYNAVSAGAITIDDGIEVIIADTFGWSIV